MPLEVTLPLGEPGWDDSSGGMVGHVPVMSAWGWPLIAIGVVFHAAMYLTLTVYTFSMTMCILYIAFFDPWDVHRELDRLHGPVSAPGGVTTPSTPESAGRPPADQSRV